VGDPTAFVAVSGSTVGGDIRTTVHLHVRTQRAAAAVVAVRPDQRADTGFVGREDELSQLLASLDPNASTAHPTRPSTETLEGLTAGRLMVTSVAGAPGVGKTALAQAAARAAVAREWFPGGVLTMDLHGYDTDSAEIVWPAQLYAALLRGLGVPGENVPATEPEQGTVYHQLLVQLAEQARPVLLVLDNVGDAEQVLPLLPQGTFGHRILVTSRDTLGALPDARLLDLAVLKPEASVRLLDVGLRRRWPGDARVDAAPGAAARLVEVCGFLPLALQIVAALLGDEPERPIGELATELADEGTRLGGLTYGPRWAVRAAFDLSHRRLTAEHAWLFRVLAAIPGADTSLAVAAAATDLPEPVARAGLMALCRAHLLEQHQPGRWRMHDLIRLYADEQLPDTERAARFERVLGYYRRTAELARRRFTAVPADSGPAGFDTPAEAMAWVVSEGTGLVAAARQAMRTHPEHSVYLARDLTPILPRARLLSDWVTIATVAVSASEATPDGRLAATAWNILGMALREVRRFEEAIAALQRSLAMFGEVGDRYNEAQAWGNLGNALQEARGFEEAIAALQRAGAMFREVGDRHGEAKAWNNLGAALQQARRFEEAIAAHKVAGEVYREVGDRHGEAKAWNNLGAALQQARRFEEAIAAHKVAGEVYREVGDRHAEGQTRNNLGVSLRSAGRVEESIAAHQWAEELLREAGDRHGEGKARGNLALSLSGVGRFEEAIAAHQVAIAILAELGDGYGEAQTSTYLGDLLAQQGRLGEAKVAWIRARDLYAAAKAESETAEVRRRLTEGGQP
jgi:tetratricopeptide (TPR) repeat protein